MRNALKIGLLALAITGALSVSFPSRSQDVPSCVMYGNVAGDIQKYKQEGLDVDDVGKAVFTAFYDEGPDVQKSMLSVVEYVYRAKLTSIEDAQRTVFLMCLQSTGKGV